MIENNSEGHSEVHLNYNKYPNLGQWESTQRYTYILAKKVNKLHMTTERKKALDYIVCSLKMKEYFLSYG